MKTVALGEQLLAGQIRVGEAFPPRRRQADITLFRLSSEPLLDGPPLLNRRQHSATSHCLEDSDLHC